MTTSTSSTPTTQLDDDPSVAQTAPASRAHEDFGRSPRRSAGINEQPVQQTNEAWYIAFAVSLGWPGMLGAMLIGT